MQPTDSGKPRQRFALNPEILEDRALMTGGAGDMFAVMPATATSGKVSQVSFTISPSNFTIPKGKFELGIDVTQATNSTAKPVILSVVNSSGKPSPTKHAIYDPQVQRSNTTNGSFTTAVLTDIGFANPKSPAPTTYTVNVMTQGGTSGGYLLGFYLPGDVAGTGTVTQSDIKTIKADLKVNANSSNYNFNADANRDGKISMADLQIAKGNLGVSTTINPTVSANLDPADDPGISQGTVTASPVHYTGVATAGLTITYQGTNKGDMPVSTTADSSGNYTVYVPVDTGQNVFQVTTKDAFQQSITGDITPVYYVPKPATAK